MRTFNSKGSAGKDVYTALTQQGNSVNCHDSACDGKLVRRILRVAYLKPTNSTCGDLEADAVVDYLPLLTFLTGV